MLWQSAQPALPTNSRAPFLAAGGDQRRFVRVSLAQIGHELIERAVSIDQTIFERGNRLGEVHDDPLDGRLIIRCHAIPSIAKRLRRIAGLTSGLLAGLGVERKPRPATRGARRVVPDGSAIGRAIGIERALSRVGRVGRQQGSEIRNRPRHRERILGEHRLVVGAIERGDGPRGVRAVAAHRRFDRSRRLCPQRIRASGQKDQRIERAVQQGRRIDVRPDGPD